MTGEPFVEPANQHTAIACQSGSLTARVDPAHQANFDRKHPAEFESVAEAGGRKKKKKAAAILVRFNERDEEGGKQVVNFSSGCEGERLSHSGLKREEKEKPHCWMV
ncbi:hypothetical protein AMELA_G00226270 [Ameiurus melas]|uniref:Uncharacterized protein n=1 Tax=Ameiurus melas TaxID=219545 RepID=A0A7J6A2D2_AMEME|nr:hypothetical protein AMELA_G00226270 [Ameiurus melas]